MKKLSYKILGLINKYSSVRNTIFFFLVTHLIYGAMLFLTIPRIVQYSNGERILDLLPKGYRAEYVQNLFEILGSSGRATYLFNQIPLDMLFPMVFAITYSFLLSLIIRSIFSKESNAHYLIFVPILAGIFDYLENICIIVMLGIYPNFLHWLADLASVITIIKSIFYMFVFVLLGVGIFILCLKKCGRKY